MQRVKTFKTMTRAASAGLFLAVQALICIGTVYWAIAESLGMRGTAAIVLTVIFAVPTAYVLLMAVRTAYDAETDPANQ
jgi:cation transporter-like permease